MHYYSEPWCQRLGSQKPRKELRVATCTPTRHLFILHATWSIIANFHANFQPELLPLYSLY